VYRDNYELKTMTKEKLYNALKIPGTFLVPGFSIYLLEIKKENEKHELGANCDRFKKWFAFSKFDKEAVKLLHKLNEKK